MRKPSSSRSAFTLIELIVVVIVLGVLMAVAIPVFQNATRAAQDNVTKQYLTTSFRAIKACEAKKDTRQFETPAAALAACIAASEPQLTASNGICTAVAGLASRAVLVDDGSTATGIVLYGHSASGADWQLQATTSSAPQISKADCGNSGGGVSVGDPLVGGGTVTAPPSISGVVVARDGTILTANPGSFSTPPTTTATVWVICDSNGQNCVAIPGATSPSYLPVTGDVGKTIGAILTYGFPDGSIETVSTSPTPVVLIHEPTNSGGANVPSISGTPAQGTAGGSSPGTWNNYGDTSVSYAYQWQSAPAGSGPWTNASGSGASTATYTPVFADVDGYLRVCVTDTNDGGSSVTVCSAAVGPISGQPKNLTLPTTSAGSGAPLVGVSITSATGSWSQSPTTYGYQWQRNGGVWANISGANSASYTPVAGDLGDPLRLVVTATNATGSTSATTVATAAVYGAAPSAVTTGAPSGLSQTSVTMTGSANPQNVPTNGWFEIEQRVGPTYGFQSLGSGGSSVALSAAVVSDLSENAAYRYRAVAQNAVGTTNGAWSATFYTQHSCSGYQAGWYGYGVTCPAWPAPTVTTDTNITVGTTDVSLYAYANPNSSAMTAWIEIQGGSSYGSQSVGSGTSAVRYGTYISGFAQNTAYNYRGAASNSGGTAYGSWQTFYTQHYCSPYAAGWYGYGVACPVQPGPTATTGSYSSSGSGTSTVTVALYGSQTGTGVAVNYNFYISGYGYYQLPSGWGGSNSTSTDGTVSTSIQGFPQNAAISYYLHTWNAYGDATGSWATFYTPQYCSGYQAGWYGYGASCPVQPPDHQCWDGGWYAWNVSCPYQPVSGREVDLSQGGAGHSGGLTLFHLYWNAPGWGATDCYVGALNGTRIGGAGPGDYTGGFVTTGNPGGYTFTVSCKNANNGDTGSNTVHVPA
jgi:prepilin-type N-terminal cleavage/methylation domain-containing protein